MVPIRAAKVWSWVTKTRLAHHPRPPHLQPQLFELGADLRQAVAASLIHASVMACMDTTLGIASYIGKRCAAGV